MHNLDVSHDVSHTHPFVPSVEHADRVCALGCGRQCISGFWQCKSGPNQWTTHTTEFTKCFKTPVNTSVLPLALARTAARSLPGSHVRQVCKHHLHQARQTMKGGECGGNTHANQRRPDRACYLTQHRLSPPRSRRTRTRTAWLRHPHRRRISPGLHSTPPGATNTSRAGR